MTRCGLKLITSCFVALLFAQAGTLFAQSSGQTYPLKPVRVIVPFPPGGPTDILARLVGEKLSMVWGQAVIIDNRAGAAGNLGTEVAARSEPDGYTLLLVASSHAIEPAIHPKLPFDPVKDFAPVSLIASGPFLLMVHPSVAAKSVQELIALARSNPGRLTYASAGTGTANHLGGELFKKLLKIDMLHVPYNGAAPATQALLGGVVNILFNNMPSGLPYVRTATVRTLAVTSLKRAPSLPDIPTVSESGVPGFDVQTWYGIVAPAGTRQEIVQKTSQEIARTLSREDVRARLAGLGLDPVGSTPEQFGAYIRSEVSKWAEVARVSGARAD